MTREMARVMARAMASATGCCCSSPSPSSSSAIGYGVYWQTVLRLRETTDDAYVNGNIVQITPQIAGTVVGINADDTQYVAVGQTLVRLDPADAKVALDGVRGQSRVDGTFGARPVRHHRTTGRGTGHSTDRPRHRREGSGTA